MCRLEHFTRDFCCEMFHRGTVTLTIKISYTQIHVYSVPERWIIPAEVVGCCFLEFHSLLLFSSVTNAVFHTACAILFRCRNCWWCGVCWSSWWRRFSCVTDDDWYNLPCCQMPMSSIILTFISAYIRYVCFAIWHIWNKFLMKKIYKTKKTKFQSIIKDVPKNEYLSH